MLIKRYTMAKTTQTSRLNQIRLMLYGILLKIPIPAQFLEDFKTPTMVFRIREYLTVMPLRVI